MSAALAGRAIGWLAVVRMELRAAAKYRANVAIQAGTSLLTIAVLYFFWKAVFAAQVDIQGLDFGFMLRYVLISQFILATTRVSGIAYRVSDKVRDGSLVIHMPKPYGLLGYLFGTTIAECLWRAGWVGVPLLLASVGLRLLPVSGSLLGFFVPSLVIALLTNVAVELCLGMSAFWLRRSDGVVQLYGFFQAFLSGALYPLALLPATVQDVVQFLPFRAALDIPIGYYTGYSSASDFILQIGWCVASWALCLWILSRAQKRFVGFGG